MFSNSIKMFFKYEIATIFKDFVLFDDDKNASIVLFNNLFIYKID